MKPGDAVVVKLTGKQVEVHEVDDAHVTVKWVSVGGNTEHCTYLAHELEPYVEPTPEPVKVEPKQEDEEPKWPKHDKHEDEPKHKKARR